MLRTVSAGCFRIDAETREFRCGRRDFDLLAHLARCMVTGDGLQVPTVFAVNAASRWSLACLDHVEYGNVSRVAGECISAVNPVVRQKHARCGKSLEDLGQCFMGQSIEFGQVIGAE